MAKLLQVFQESLAVIVGSFFVLSAIAKVGDSAGTAAVLKPVWPWMSAREVLLVSLVEFVLGLCLLLRIYRYTVWLVTAVMLVGFTVGLAYGKANGLEDCGCFGTTLRASAESAIGRNILLLLLASAALVLQAHNSPVTVKEVS